MTYGRKYKSRSSSKQARKSSAVVVSRRRRTAKVSGLRLAPQVRKLVDRRINKAQETNRLTAFVISNKPLDKQITQADLFRVFDYMAISQGVASNQRTGDRIKLVSLTLEILIKATPDLKVVTADEPLTINSLEARLLVFSPKRYPRYDDFDATARAEVCDNLLQLDQTETSHDGTWLKNRIPTNSHAITTHYDKVFRREGPVVYQKTLSNGNHIAPDWHRTFKVRMKVKGKVLRFEQGNFPANFNPCVALGFAQLDLSNVTDTNDRMNMTVLAILKWHNM